MEEGGLSYKLSVGGINVALLLLLRAEGGEEERRRREGRGAPGIQINAGGSDCLFPLFIYCHLRDAAEGQGSTLRLHRGRRLGNGPLLTGTMDITQR